jgi:hypothetical protein
VSEEPNAGEEPHFIVAEISKNWDPGKPDNRPRLFTQFEELIEANRQRGYRLHSFQLCRSANGRLQNKTVMAVFERSVP